MNILRKTFTSVLLFSALLLAGCAGGLTNEKEVTKQDFVTAVTATVGKNTYTDAHAKGTIVSDDGTGSKSVEVNQDFKYNALLATWIPGNASADIRLDHVLVDLASYEALFTQYKITPNFKYYVGDNGFRLTSDFTKEITQEGAKVNLSLKLNMLYNEFGYPTSGDADVMMKISFEAREITSSGKTNINVTYTTQNA